MEEANCFSVQEENHSVSDIEMGTDYYSNDKNEKYRDQKAAKQSGAKDSIPFIKLFAFADPLDMVLMIMGSLGAAISGLGVPLATLLFGQLTDIFGMNNDIIHQVSKLCLKFTYLGAAISLASFFEVAMWMCTGERQASRIRHLYLKAMLRQDIAFFDKETLTGEAVGRMSADTILIQDALGEKAGKFIELLCTCIGGFAVAFLKGWKLAAVMLSATPLIAGALIVTSVLISKISVRVQQANVEADQVVNQTITAIKTVASFTGEEKAERSYTDAMVGAYKATVKQGLIAGLGIGLSHLLTFCTYALALWYGTQLVLEQGYSGGTIMNVIFAVISAGGSLGQASPCLNAFAAGRAAASKIFQVIEREPDIDIYKTEGLILNDLKGEIELRDVYFSYPTRPNSQIFSGFSLRIPSGTTAALVGESGSGKSTLINLIERFYDPQVGQVLIDFHDIRNFQLKWFRQQLGLVSQELVLFRTTLKENIAYGKEGVTMEEIKAAAEYSNAAMFIKLMPQGFDTMVGEHGTQLSGGQKQRIAIARAVLRNPRILLLDEATSALDAKSENTVQDALNRLMMNRTTVIVAHRLSTIRNADFIAVIQNGSIIEKGTHVQLIQDPASAYYQLIRLQEIKSTEEQPLNDPDEIQNLQLDSHSVVRYDNKRFLYNEISFPLKSLHSKVKNSCESISFHDELAKDVTKSERRIYFSRFASFNKAEIPILVLGSIAAALNGLIPPLFGLLLGGVIHSLYEVPDTLKKNCNFWALVSSFLGVTAFIVTPSQMLCFSIAGGRLMKRLRVMVFKRVLHQEIGWFEKTENSSGALGARLSTDAAHVRSIVGEALSLVAQNITTIIVAIAIAFRVNWMFAILILCLLPMIGIQAFLQVKLAKGFSAKIQMMYEDASQLASDAVGSIRTVASFCAEEKIVDLYTEKCNVSLQSGMKKGILSGLGIGLTNFLMFGAYSLIFWIGVRLIRHGNTSFDKLFTVFFALLMSVIGVSHSISLAPSISKLKLSVISIFAILERRSKIDPSDTSGMVLNNVRGEIIFHSVSFKYPTRPDIQIFQDMCLSIDSGKASGTIPLLTFSETGYLQIVALVGESGSGKSTIISLLQRFYDPDSGNIFLDGVKLRSLQIKWLRQQMGLVSQEPILFADTIRSNIAYGCGKERVISDEEIISAAKSCNAHTFISMLPQGYETYVGERGMQLSGGQKQRIAIARAIIKNPKILLFDEATSALDVESEHIVQNALDNVILNRTTIIVAHRFATIQNADIIVVVKNGIIAEQGCHDELICKVDGIYASLLKPQAAS